jgi:hypothetical protein
MVMEGVGECGGCAAAGFPTNGGGARAELTLGERFIVVLPGGLRFCGGSAGGAAGRRSGEGPAEGGCVLGTAMAEMEVSRELARLLRLLRRLDWARSFSSSTR